jgi:superfamily II DNA or RNA helicase
MNNLLDPEGLRARPVPQRWTVVIEPVGLRYRPDQGGRLYGDALESVFLQWEDEGFALRTEDGWFIEWNALYDLLDSSLYDDVRGDVGIPPTLEIVPRLVSHGGLTDPDFTIGIAGWHRADGLPLDQVEPVGACVRVDGSNYLLPRRVWELIEKVRAFLQRDPEEREARSQRLAWGAIRRAAIQAGARLDDFLYRTVVLAPERLHIDLRKAVVAGEKVVEVTPGFEDNPDGWVASFDRFSRVQDRYDLPTPEGVVQVVVSPEVKTVLEQIKRMPGRRVAGVRAEAFLANPFATLGETAAKVIDVEQFEQSKVEAGLTLDHFTACVETDDQGFPTELGILVQTGVAPAARSERVRFRDDAEAEKFVASVRSRVQRQLQVCPWGEFELELDGDTENELRILEESLQVRRGPRPAWVLPATVFDLSRYSERIEGFGVEKPYASLYIAKKDDGEGWFPDNAVFLVGAPGPDGTTQLPPQPLTPAQIDELEGAIKAAVRDGRTNVHVPGATEDVPVSVAQNIVKTIRGVQTELKKGDFDPQSPRAGRRVRKSLLIKPNIASVDYLEQRRELLKERISAELPAGIKAEVALKQHQLEGLAWLQHLFSQSPEHCRGAVLADDMGLGKTLQLLCLIAWARQQKPQPPPALVVAPVALLENWREEMQRFFEPGTLKVHVVYGDTLASLRLPAHEIDQQLREEGLVKFLKPGWVGDADVVLTTYETLRDHEFSFAEQKWSVIVCDEAHKIKNPNALVTRAAKKQNARFRVACTGTPVENTLADLWCLFDFVQPGYLGALNEFGQKYRRPIEAKTEDERTRVEELRGLIDPQIKRRLKKDVAKDLPQKIEDTSCKQLSLSEVQRSLYAQAIGQFSRRQDPGTATPFKNALGLLHYLRVVCTDPQPYGLGGFKAESLEQYRAKAPKLGWLLEVLGEIRRRNEKALIFCEFRDMQRLLRHYIHGAFGYAADIINGDTAADSRSAESRQKRIAAFQRQPGFGVIILSPLAVGFGVNIQAANHVIHYTRTWNPAKEDQATDRAYRIGQTRDVYVYCPVVRAPDFTTFDVKLDELLARKRSLAEDMLNGSGDIGPAEFDIGEVAPRGSAPPAERPLTIDDIDKMAPRYFEAYAAALWSRQGFSSVTLTPTAGDGGVDVVAMRSNGPSELVQCKTSARPELGWDAIKDVVTGEAAFRTRYPGVEFQKVCMTNQLFNANAREQASFNKVRLVDRRALERLASDQPLTLAEIERVLYPDWGARG